MPRPRATRSSSKRCSSTSPRKAGSSTPTAGSAPTWRPTTSTSPRASGWSSVRACGVQAGPAADPKRTFQYLVMAGKWALQAAAFEEALAHLERAAERIDAAGPTERADLLFRLGAAQRSGGQWDEAISTWEQAIDAYE